MMQSGPRTSQYSRSWGYGAVWENAWLQGEWNQQWLSENIATKELLPIVLAVAVWGQSWRHKQLLIIMAVVQVINAQNCRDPQLLQLLRRLHFYAALLDISFKAHHIEGVCYISADTISCNNMQVLFQHNPLANKQPSEVP